MEKKSRYDNLRTMTREDLEGELNFYTFLGELVDVTMTQDMKMRNKTGDRHWNVFRFCYHDLKWKINICFRSMKTCL